MGETHLQNPADSDGDRDTWLVLADTYDGERTGYRTKPICETRLTMKGAHDTS